MNIRMNPEKMNQILAALEIKEKEIFRLGPETDGYFRFFNGTLETSAGGEPPNWVPADTQILADIFAGKRHLMKFPTMETRIKTIQRLYEQDVIRQNCLDVFDDFLQKMREKEFNTFINNLTSKQLRELMETYFPNTGQEDNTPVLCMIENEKNRRALEKWINQK